MLHTKYFLNIDQRVLKDSEILERSKCGYFILLTYIHLNLIKLYDDSRPWLFPMTHGLRKN